MRLFAVMTIALTLALPAAAQNTSPSSNMPTASGAQDTRETLDTTGTAGQSDQTNADVNRNDADRGQLPATASPLGLILLGGFAALGGAAALRRLRM
jgi:hypothetical protein